MSDYSIEIHLRSDTSFGRGDGVAGLVDAEVQHGDDGLPYLNGRTLKGLLRDECQSLMFVLQQPDEKKNIWLDRAIKLFGLPGNPQGGASALHIGDARLPQALREVIENSLDRNELTREQVLDSLTAVRKQTAINAETGVPQDNSLRSQRVILRETIFEAPVWCAEALMPAELGLLAACVKALRRAGAGRNRGRGAIEALLRDAQGFDQTDTLFNHFKAEVLK